MYLVFSQYSERLPDVPRLAAQAKSLCGAAIEVVERSVSRLRIRFASSKHGVDAVLTIRERDVTGEDIAHARQAEARGRAAGMADLAARCKVAWELDGDGDANTAALLVASAVCAAIALGPVMPPDQSTLFGIRGALERLERATRS